MKFEVAYDVEQWYDKLKDFTFETKFLPLTNIEALIIRKKYKFLFLKAS